MEKNNLDDKKQQIQKLEADLGEYKEIESSKINSSQELERNKKYLIEEVVDDGDSLVQDMETKRDVNLDYESPYQKMVHEYYNFDDSEPAVVQPKKSLWGKLVDFIFK
jgi:hypothetical protein